MPYARFTSSPQRGDFPPGTQRYGQSQLGAPLLWFPAPLADSRSGLILAGTHGDENSSIVTLSCALRTLKPELRRHHVRSIRTAVSWGYAPTPAAFDLNRNFRRQTGKKGKRFIAGTARRNSATWCC
jgi:protein MpaA